MQKKVVGYLGPEGTFTHEVTQYMDNNNSYIKPYNTITDVLEAVSISEIDKAIVPIENSTEGSVDLTLDLLAHSYDLKISLELIMPIKQNLLVQKNKTINDIQVICSHSQAIAQCRKYLNKLNKQIHTMPSTANAARYVLEFDNAAVIGNNVLADIYNLKILDEEIQDYSNNVTRFVLISNEDQKKSTGHYKTSIIISLMGDEPGRLYEILQIFTENNVNLTKIESRPSKKGLGNYLFFIDMEGHRLDNKISNSLNLINEQVNTLKVLGSYQSTIVGGN